MPSVTPRTTYDSPLSLVAVAGTVSGAGTVAVLTLVVTGKCQYSYSYCVPANSSILISILKCSVHNYIPSSYSSCYHCCSYCTCEKQNKERVYTR